LWFPPRFALRRPLTSTLDIRTMRRERVLGIAAISLWLTTLTHLSPLPPDEVEHEVEVIHRALSEPPMSLPNWSTRPQWEKERTEKSWRQSEQFMRDFLRTAHDQEVALWAKWWARALLIAVAITGWLLFIIRGTRPTKLSVGTTCLLVLGYATYNSSVYSFWFHEITQESHFFRILPFSISLVSLFDYVVVPLGLIGLTIGALKTQPDVYPAHQSNLSVSSES
jgi:hypothetical protein